MPEPLDQSPRPADPEVRAFVLRVRIDAGPEQQRRDIIDVEDVRTMKVWRQLSLEEAFERIRMLIGQGDGNETEPPN